MSNVPLPEPDWILEVRQWLQDRMHTHAAAVSAAKDAEIAQLRADAIDRQINVVMPLRRRVDVLEDALRAIDKECFSHVDGRDLFAQMHPRNTLDIKRRVDARETWFDGDWLTNLWAAIKAARTALAARKGEA